MSALNSLHIVNITDKEAATFIIEAAWTKLRKKPSELAFYFLPATNMSSIVNTKFCGASSAGTKKKKKN